MSKTFEQVSYLVVGYDALGRAMGPTEDEFAVDSTSEALDVVWVYFNDPPPVASVSIFIRGENKEASLKELLPVLGDFDVSEGQLCDGDLRIEVERKKGKAA